MSENEAAVSAAAYRALREAAYAALQGCACNAFERADGHLVDCYGPELREAIDAADATLAAIPDAPACDGDCPHTTQAECDAWAAGFRAGTVRFTLAEREALTAAADSLNAAADYGDRFTSSTRARVRSQALALRAMLAAPAGEVRDDRRR